MYIYIYIYMYREKTHSKLRETQGKVGTVAPQAERQGGKKGRNSI